MRGLPPDISLHGGAIDTLLHITHAFVALLLIISVGWLGLSLLLHRRNNAAVYERGSGRRQVLLALAISGFVFFVVDGNLFVGSVRYVFEHFSNFAPFKGRSDVIRVEVNAHQFAWDFRTAGPDGRFNTADDVVSWNELRVPAHVPVLLELTSTDVIHSLNAPNLRLKMDVVPGQLTRVWFQAEQEGGFELGCAQLCGANHYQMRGALIVMGAAEYARWAKEASAIATRAFDDADEKAHWGWAWRGE